MAVNQKIITAIAFFIVLSALIISGCKSPIGSRDFPESFDTTIEDTLQETNLADEETGRKPLTLIIKNLASPKAPVNVVFYQAKNKFLSKTDRLKGYNFIPHENILTVQIKDISYGELAIAAYQDVNSDGKCNKNRIGIPQEPYGFSNNFKPFLKPPRFNDCKFTYSANANTLTLSLLR